MILDKDLVFYRIRTLDHFYFIILIIKVSDERNGIIMYKLNCYVGKLYFTQIILVGDV